MPASRLISMAQRIEGLPIILVFIVLDEPTVALAVSEVRKVLDFVRRIKESGRACVYIEHNLAHVHEVADRLVVLDRGAVVAEISPKTMSVPELTEYLIALQH